MKKKQWIAFIPLVMRTSLIQLLLLLVFVISSSARNVHAQDYLKKDISITARDVEVKKLLRQIQDSAQVRFVYSSKVIDIHRKVSFDWRQKPLGEVLEVLSQSLDIRYRIIDNEILLFKVIDTPSAVVPASLAGAAPLKDIPVKGVVTNAKGSPLEGVSVLIKGGERGTVTDAQGRFTVYLPETATGIELEFSIIGYEPRVVKVNAAQGMIRVQLTETAAGLNDVVIVGYGTIRKTDLTGAVANIKSEDLKTAGVNSVDKALQGKLAGVEVESAGGDPGSGMRILIRGVGTINNTDPLYVVDGVPVSSISNLAPDDISDISVLKDASAAAIYGTRAANGVVLISTKSGVAGKTMVSFSTYYGRQKIEKKLSVLNAEQWANVSNAAHDAAGLPRLAIADNPDSLGAGTNWQNAIYKTAPIQNYELNVSGGTRGNNYSVSGGYLNQQGIVDETGYARYNLRVKSESTKGRFKIGETVLLSQENWNVIPGSWGGQGGNPVGAAAKLISAFHIYDSTDIGGYGGAYGPVVNVENPVAQLHLETVKKDAIDVLANAYAQVDLVKGLNFKVNLGYTNNSTHNSNYTERYQVGALFSNPTNNITESRDNDLLYLVENTVNYNAQFGKSSLQALAGYSLQDEHYNIITSSANGLPDGIQQIDAATGARSDGGNAAENTLISVLGRAVYSYDQRYLLTASFRRDGSSRFGPGNRYGNFPSVAAGWNISNESFFSNLKQSINTWKLRASYGVLGNQEIGNYQYDAAINSNINYVTGTTPTRWTGAVQQSFADPDIKWETSKTSDIGTDMSFLGRHLNFTADYYNKRTVDMLVQVPIPGSAGSSTNPYVNAGSIQNYGVELALSYSGGKGDFTYNAYGTFSTNKNKVIALGTGSQQIIGGQPTLHGEGTTTTQVGGEVGAFYLIRTQGLFNSQAEINAYQDKAGNLIQPNAKPGDIKFYDANGDGVISDADKVYRGSPNPKFTYGAGFNGAWKGFDLSVYFQGTYGNKIYNGFRMDIDGMNLEMNYSTATLNAWTPDKHTNFPRAVIDDPNYNDRVSDRFLESGSYLRCKTLQAGYHFSSRLLQRVQVSSLRIYAGFDNLFTVTGYSGFNPDLGRTGSIFDRGVDFSYANYPLARTATVGVQLTF